MGKKVVTVKEFLDALEANNTPHHRGGWFNRKGGDKGLIGAACILGQACINLGVTHNSLQTELGRIKSGSASQIISLNDSTSTPYPAMVKQARRIFEGLEHHTLELDTDFFYSKIGKA